ncbi:MAG: hypothetical protein IT515_18645 [Burkholderiales bacterium]|nr:hypothetical protein [Burkholderiales bacterium]
MDLNAWFHWLFPSPGYFLLALAGLLVLFGLIGGLTDSRVFTEADPPPPDEEDRPSSRPWWTRDEEHYREWNEHQARERRRTAGNGSAPD